LVGAYHNANKNQEKEPLGGAPARLDDGELEIVHKYTILFFIRSARSPRSARAAGAHLTDG